LIPSSAREYFPVEVDATWRFQEGNNARDTTVILNQNGQHQLLSRLSVADEKVAVDGSVAAERRFQEQTPAPGSEAALRRWFAGLQEHKPNYDEMVAPFAQEVREDLTELSDAIRKLGSIQSMTFRRVGAAGQDVYSLQFEHGEKEAPILLTPDGHIHAVEFPL
jgi:hypothetical protein